MPIYLYKAECCLMQIYKGGYMNNVLLRGQRKQRLINDDNIDLNTTWSSEKIDGVVGEIAYGKNILHNWDFRSPLNAVNQRGNREPYAFPSSTAGYGIDRWVVGQGSMRLASNRLELVALTNNPCWLGQRIENGNLYVGKQVTLSVIFNSIIYSFTTVVPSRTEVASPTFPVYGTFYYMRLIWHGNDLVYQLMGNTSFINGAISHVQAAKLEIGSVSTLANDPPMDFGRELAVCQRHKFPLNGFYPKLSSTLSGGGGTSFIVALPVVLRANPTFVGSASVHVRGAISNVLTQYSLTSHSITNDRTSMLFAFSGPVSNDVVMGVVGLLDANL